MNGINPTVEDILYNLEIYAMAGMKELSFVAEYPYSHLQYIREKGYNPELGTVGGNKFEKPPKNRQLVAYTIQIKH